MRRARGIPWRHCPATDYGLPSIQDGSGKALKASAIGNPHLFRGRRYDPETGWYEVHGRHMDPRAGRFTSQDPLGTWGDASGLGNGAAYAGDSPWTLAGPRGVDAGRRTGSRGAPPPPALPLPTALPDGHGPRGVLPGAQARRLLLYATLRNAKSSDRDLFPKPVRSCNCNFPGYADEWFIRDLSQCLFCCFTAKVACMSPYLEPRTNDPACRLNPMDCPKPDPRSREAPGRQEAAPEVPGESLFEDCQIGYDTCVEGCLLGRCSSVVIQLPVPEELFTPLPAP